MPRMGVNRSGELEAFITAIDRGGFSAAARILGMTPSAMSKLITRLEARLGVRLVQRSTRALRLTDEGRAFYDRGVRLLADLDEAERNAAASAEPRGRVVINTSLPIANAILLPIVPRLARDYPALELDIVVTDRVIDLVEERTDIAIRWGALPSSDLVARKLGDSRQVIVGSRAYLERAGTPRTGAELKGHDQLGWADRRSARTWPLRSRGRTIQVPVTARVRVADGESMRRLAIAGVGLARLSRYHVHDDLARGRLVAVLDELNPGDTSPIHAVFLGRSGRLTGRIRAVLAFLEAHAGAMLREMG